MIYDFSTTVSCSAPGDGVPVTYSTDGIDLTDGSDGVPALFGTGERLFMQFEVTTAFVVGAGAPLAQFGVAVDTATGLTTTAHVLAMTGGSIATNIGVAADSLTLGRVFHLSIPSWEDIMEIDTGVWPYETTAATLATFRTIKYLGVVIQQPMPIADSANFFSAGAVDARIIKDPSGMAVLSNIYGSRMGVL